MIKYNKFTAILLIISSNCFAQQNATTQIDSTSLNQSSLNTREINVSSSQTGCFQGNYYVNGNYQSSCSNQYPVPEPEPEPTPEPGAGGNGGHNDSCLTPAQQQFKKNNPGIIISCN